MKTEPAWDYFRTFLSVLRNGSLSGAARELHLTQPTIGRQIAALEQSLGGKALFTRSQSGLLPTRTALELQPHAENMAASAAVMVRASSSANAVKGTVRITASDMIGVEVLPPVLRTFSAANPDITITVRMVQPSQKALFAKRVGRISIGLHAHRQYLDRHPTPMRLEDLEHHVMIGFDQIPAYAKNLTVGGKPVTRDAFNFRTDSDAVQLAALRAGVGIGACQFGIARRNSDLVPLLTREFSLSYDTWVVMHEDQKKVERVRAMFDHLARAMTEYCVAAGPPKN